MTSPYIQVMLECRWIQKFGLCIIINFANYWASGVANFGQFVGYVDWDVIENALKSVILIFVCLFRRK